MIAGPHINWWSKIHLWLNGLNDLVNNSEMYLKFSIMNHLLIRIPTNRLELLISITGYPLGPGRPGGPSDPFGPGTPGNPGWPSGPLSPRKPGGPGRPMPGIPSSPFGPGSPSYPESRN